MNSFVLIKIFTAFVLPPASLILGTAVGIGLLFLGRHRIATLAIGLAFAQTAILSLPVVSDGLLGVLEGEARQDAAKASPCCYDVIVVFGAGVVPAVPPERLEPQLSYGSDRLWKAARLYHQGVAPSIIISAGRYEPTKDAPVQPSPAEAMKRFLVDLGVPADAIVTENRARNTLENCAYTRDLAKGERIALVTSAFHMPRALRLAKKTGLNAAAFPAEFLARPLTLPFGRLWIPSAGSLFQATVALKEVLALIFDYRAVPKAL